MAGLGMPGKNGGEPGNLYIDIMVEDHPIFERRNEHLLAKLPVEYSTLLLGGKIQFNTFNGTFDVKIPAGTTVEEKIVKKGKGMPIPNTNQHGDLILFVDLKVPKKLNKEQKKAVSALRDLGL